MEANRKALEDGLRERELVLERLDLAEFEEQVKPTGSCALLC